MTDESNATFSDTTAVIDAFGGIRPMAHKLGVPVSTVQGWKQRNAIPENRVADILAAAEAHEIDVANIVMSSDLAAEAAADGHEPDEATSEPVSPAPETAPPPAEAPGDARQSSDRSALIVAGLALIVALAMGGWLGLRSGGESFAPAAGPDLARVTERLDALEAARPDGTSETLQRQFSAEIADLRAEIDRIAEGQTGTAGPTEELEALADEFAAVESEFDRLQSELDQVRSEAAREAQAAADALSAAQDDIAQLRQQLTALGETRTITGQNVSGAIALALAAGALQRAIDKGEPYADSLATIRGLAAADAAVGAIADRLAAQAAAGVATPDALALEFPGVARAIVAAAADDTAGGWTGRALHRIRNTVSIRRVGPAVAGDAPDARVARAEAKLLGNDLSGAVAELAGLQGNAAAAAAAWLERARARLDAEAAVGELEALAIGRLQANNGGS